MGNKYVKAYPKYKLEAFNKIESVVLGLLKEANFFDLYPFLENEPRVVLTYNEVDFSKEKEEARGGMVKGFNVFVGGSFLFTLKGKELHTTSKLRKRLSDKESNTIYNNLRILHQFPGEKGTMIESKIGRIVKYSISNHDNAFIGQFGDTYDESVRFLR
jgi:hypothetical protein